MNCLYLLISMRFFRAVGNGGSPVIAPQISAELHRNKTFALKSPLITSLPPRISRLSYGPDYMDYVRVKEQKAE